jgi:hypothetical protein
MNKDQRIRIVNKLINTSVEDCRISLQNYHDPHMLMDLLIVCARMGHVSRAHIVRQRIASLMVKCK